MDAEERGKVEEGQRARREERTQAPTFVAVKTRPPELLIHKNDWLMSLLERWDLSSWQVFLFFLVLFVGAKAALAWFAGAFWMKDGVSALAIDFGCFPPFRLLGRLLSLEPTCGGGNPAYVPYVRDYADIAIGVLMAMHMVLVRNQWRRISLAHRSLWQKGVLRDTVIGSEKYVRISEEFRQRFEQRWWRMATLAAAAAAVAIVSLSIGEHGIYRSLNPLHLSGCENAAYANWWANPRNHPVLFGYWFLMEVVICAYFFRHVVVGVLAVWLCRQIFRRPKSDSESGADGDEREPLLKLLPTHTDELGGLRIVRQIMYRVYLSILIGSVTFLMLYYCFGTSSEVVDAIFIVYFVANPFFVVVPLWVIAQHVAAAKEYEIGRLENQIEEAAKAKDAAQVQVLQSQIELFGEVPEWLFSAKRLMSFGVEYLVPVVGFVRERIAKG